MENFEQQILEKLDKIIELLSPQPSPSKKVLIEEWPYQGPVYPFTGEWTNCNVENNKQNVENKGEANSSKKLLLEGKNSYIKVQKENIECREDFLFKKGFYYKKEWDVWTNYNNEFDSYDIINYNADTEEDVCRTVYTDLVIDSLEKAISIAECHWSLYKTYLESLKYNFKDLG